VGGGDVRVRGDDLCRGVALAFGISFIGLTVLDFKYP
jgi:hypothetical protein